MNLKYPIEHGIVKDWNDMEKVWEHIFKNELRVESERKNVMLTGSPMNPKVNREKMSSIMLEKFFVQGFYIEFPAILSLYPAGKFQWVSL